MARMSREERAEGLEARLKRAEKRLASQDFATMEMDGQPDLTTLHDEDGEPDPDPDEDEEPPDPVQEEKEYRYSDPPLDGDETEWTADFPPEQTDAVLEALGASALIYRPVTEADADRLWDWVRADEDKGLKFLGLVPTTSSEMRARLDLYGEAIAAIDEGSVHIGFGGFSPVTETHAMIHLYLSADVRGQLPRLAPHFIAESRRRYPTLKLTVIVNDPVEMRLYRSFGFTAKHLLTLDPPSVV